MCQAQVTKLLSMTLTCMGLRARVTHIVIGDVNVQWHRWGGPCMYWAETPSDNHVHNLNLDHAHLSSLG